MRLRAFPAWVLFGLTMLVLPQGLATGQEKADGKDGAKEKTELVDVFGATMKVPSAFKRVPLQSRILEHEFQASVGEGKDAKTARVTMMAAGGNVEQNIQRWKSQFVGGDKEKQKVEQFKIDDWQVYIVDVSGTYAERVGGGPFAGGRVVQRNNYAMMGAILVHPSGRKYFVKMIGPAEVVKANREAFLKMIKSIG